MIENPPIVDTRSIKNFLTDEEINLILQEENDVLALGFGKSPFFRDGILQNQIMGLGDANSPHLSHQFLKTRELLSSKMKAEFGDDVEVNAMHILESYQPYKTHTDGTYGEYGISEKRYGAWTCVLPLETCNSSTIIFDQWYLKSKVLHDWLEDVNPPVLDAIDQDTYQKYLNLEWDEYMKRLSIETIFPWERGDMLAASRYKFHCSDNFPGNGLTCKKAIIMWTTLPY